MLVDIDSRHWKISTGRHFQNGRHNTAKIQHCPISLKWNRTKWNLWGIVAAILKMAPEEIFRCQESIRDIIIYHFPLGTINSYHKSHGSFIGAFLWLIWWKIETCSLFDNIINVYIKYQVHMYNVKYTLITKYVRTGMHYLWIWASTAAVKFPRS
jgi:hypothetical protein